jgi:RHS repeat-associated protein
LDGDLVGQYTSASGARLVLTDIHGDAIGDVGTGSGTTAPDLTRDQDEFGVPTGAGDDSRFQWLGGKQRQTQTTTGVITMGARVYVPQIGRFLQVDPVFSGGANDYDYGNQDPVNEFDLDGQKSKKANKAASQAAGTAAKVGVGLAAGKKVVRAPAPARSPFISMVTKAGRLSPRILGGIAGGVGQGTADALSGRRLSPGARAARIGVAAGIGAASAGVGSAVGVACTGLTATIGTLGCAGLGIGVGVGTSVVLNKTVGTFSKMVGLGNWP